MKEFLKLFILSTFLISFLTSCDDKDDQPKIDPIVGEWVLEKVTFSDAPSEFLRFNGVTQDNLISETKYTIKFKGDQTYLRSRQLSGTFLEDEGDWVLNGDDLRFFVSESDLLNTFVDFNVESMTIEDLVLSTPYPLYVYPDEIFNDPVALDTLTDEEVGFFRVKYAEQISLRATLELKKQ